MSKRFSTLLLTGKAATLPFLFQQAHAQITPTYQDVTTERLSQVQLPVANKVQLNALGNDAYGGAATLCTNTGIPNNLSLAITGLKDGDDVFVLTSLSKGGTEAFNPNLRIGMTGLLVPLNFKINLAGLVNPDARSTSTVALNLDVLRTQGNYTLTNAQPFYMQTVVFPAGVFGSEDMWQRARVSELDTININTCSTYGGGGAY